MDVLKMLNEIEGNGRRQTKEKFSETKIGKATQLVSSKIDKSSVGNPGDKKLK